MLKLSDNPPQRYPEAAELAELPGNWWVAHTKSRFEKAFAWDLLHHGVPYYLPMVEQTRISSGKKRRVLNPLFTSYVFFCGNDEQRYQALATNRLCQTLPVNDPTTLVRQLRQIEQAVGRHARLDLCRVMEVGRRCRVRSGLFRGMEGAVVQRRGATTIILEVSMLGQGAAMEIDADLLESME